MQSNSPGGSTSIHRGGSPGSPKGTAGKTFTFEQHGVSSATVAGSTTGSSNGSSGGGRGSGRFYQQKSGGVTTLGGGAGTARDGGSGSGSSPCHCLRAVFFIPIVIFVLVLWNLVQSQISIMSFSSPAAPPVTSVVLPDGGTAGHRASARRKQAPPTYRQCDWVPGGPVFYQLATKLGVNYDAGHWFHMAENFLTAHSALRQLHRLAAINSTATAGEVFYNFDDRRFVGGLNGVTKLLVALGTVDTLLPSGASLADSFDQVPMARRVRALHYLHIPPATPLLPRKGAATADATDATTDTGSSISGGGSALLRRQRVADLRAGDTFLLDLDWAQSQVTEVVWPVQQYAKKMFVAGTVTSGGGVRFRTTATTTTSTTSTTPLLQPARDGPGKMLRGRGRGRHRRRLATTTTAPRAGAATTSTSNSSTAADVDPLTWRPPTPEEAPALPARPTLASEVCVKHLGAVGGVWPTPQRGHWFPRPGDVQTLRTKIAQLCPANEAAFTGTDPWACKTAPRKLVIYQRDRSRKLSNMDEALRLLGERFPAPDWSIQVLVHSSARSPCELAHLLHNVDVLVTPHGFQSMLLLFLPQPAVLFEVFPYRYYKRGYGPLGGEYGVVHGGAMSPPGAGWLARAVLSMLPTKVCMLSKWCRELARGEDCALTAHGANRLAALVAAHHTALDPALPVRSDAPPPRPDEEGKYAYRTALYTHVPVPERAAAVSRGKTKGAGTATAAAVRTEAGTGRFHMCPT